MTAAQSPFGRIDDDGTVYVVTPEGERAIGSWQAGSPEAGLAFYERKYDDLAAEVRLLEQRAAHDPARTAAGARRLRTELPNAAVIGDLADLDRRLADIEAAAATAQAELAEKRAAERAKLGEQKESLVREAEQLVERMSSGSAHSRDWRSVDDTLRQLLDRWKQLPRLDRAGDDALWTRLSAARSALQRLRRTHFAELDEKRKAAAARKEQLIRTAEELATSTEWAATANRFRELMAEWKAAGAAPKDSEEALWARFRAAQDAFFAARKQARSEREAEFAANLAARETVLAEAETLDPKTDLAGSRRRLRELQQRWEATGPVPRSAAAALEQRFRAVEERVRAAREGRLRVPRDPHDSPFVSRLQESIDKLERRIERARAAGDERTVQEASATLATHREWLAQATSAGRRQR